MRISVSEKPKLVCFWLENNEQPDVENDFTILNEEYRKNGYQTAVFRSGRGNIVENTKNLLLHNKEVIAQKSAEFMLSDNPA